MKFSSLFSKNAKTFKNKNHVAFSSNFFPIVYLNCKFNPLTNSLLCNCWLKSTKLKADFGKSCFSQMKRQRNLIAETKFGLIIKITANVISK